jgi:tRNA-Thr(GGU) m(6)t(6)A37 methyltransferase TsaA
MYTVTLTPIGVVKNSIHERPETWAAVESTIHLEKQYVEALEGLEEFSHIVVVFYLHLSSSYVLKVHPKGKKELPEVGVFSTRAPVRPNFLGVSVVELVGIDENRIHVKGLDAFDGTPVLDIKPHLPVNPPTRVPEWVHR